MTKNVLTALAAGAFAAAANAGTIATFADPAADGGTPLFQFTSGAPGVGVLSGGWSGNNLLLQTPGLAEPDFADARFNMAPVAAVGGPVGWTLGAGQVDFFDSSNALLFSVVFQSGTLTSPAGSGASDFAGNGVTFAGPIIPPDLTNEAFAFSFANPQGNLGSYTVTSAFTSSADRVPEPASVVLIALGAIAGLRRR
jgi:hypothetical protein